MADRKVLPEVTDLKGHKLSSEVAVLTVISKSGNVTHERAMKGDAALFKRSEAAALKWHYRPYLLNGVPVEVDTILKFCFTKNNVQVVVPSQH